MSVCFLRTHSGVSAAIPLSLGVVAALALLTEGGIPFLRYFLYRRTLTGKVVDVEPHTTSKGRRDRLIVEYICDGQTYRLRSFFPYALPAHKIGDDIPVRVSEKNVGRAMLPCDREQALNELIAGGLFLLIFGIALITNLILA